MGVGIISYPFPRLDMDKTLIIYKRSKFSILPYRSSLSTVAKCFLQSLFPTIADYRHPPERSK